MRLPRLRAGMKQQSTAPVRTATTGAQRAGQSSIGPMTDSPGEAARFLTRNAVDALPEGELERQLAKGRPLRVKLGVDPTTPDIHLGHTVVLRKLREFQDLGHTVVLIIGDYTARVGDPSGRSATRPQVDPAEIDRNAETYEEQAFRVLDRGAHRGAAQRRVARHADGGPVQAGADLDRGAAPRARRLREALRRRRADLDPRAALPAAAGLRLGGDSRRRRARRHRPEVQPASRARDTEGLRRGAAVDAHDADPAGDRRRAEDVEVARQLRGRGRPARGDVREAHAGAGRARCPPTTSCSSTRTPQADPRDAKRAHGPRTHGSLPRRGGRRRGSRTGSTPCTCATSCPTTSRSSRSATTTGRCTCPP